MTTRERRAEWIFRAVIIGLVLIGVMPPLAREPATPARTVVTEMVR